MALALDHLVLPTVDLQTARARLEALGFTVAPRGVHPFGTENACVYFGDDTFLEMLAHGDRARLDGAVRDGNVFVARDVRYRARAGDEGFSAVVLRSHDAGADHRRFADSGISAGEMLRFSREVATPAGETATATFLLAFAAESDESLSFAFTCERVGVPAIDRSTLQRHRNGCVGIARVIATAADPPGFERFLAGVANGPDIASGQGFAEVLDPLAYERRLGVAAPAASEPRFAAIGFVVHDLEHAAEVLASTSTPFARRGGTLVAAPAAGQGAVFTFEERP